MIRREHGGPCKALLEIRNGHSKSVAYKIKTTAPKLFTVRPIQGVIPPGMVAACKVQMLVTKITDREAAKNKFMIQSAETNLKQSESSMVSGFWEVQKKSG